MAVVTNRLATETSPYLQQHQENPVDWWPWGAEAFAEAARRDVPVLLSVGYAACHWCHVMAHESFEDDVTAAAMNADFVCVKVDREERPDVDAVFMQATTALTGQGGWPMTVFLTPDGRPFYAGTYFPPQPRHGLPSFGQLLDSLAQAWRERRGEVVDAGQRIAESLASRALPTGGQAPDADDLARAVRAIAGEHDTENGGFGGAPKFPPSMVLEWLLRHAARVGTDDPSGTGSLALQMAAHTLRKMAFSGMYDQVDGGFARYAVDARWVVPHFEKMLYDNALLARVYLHWWRLTGDPLGRRIALETCDWMLRGLGTAEGGLASALDADTAVPGSAHGEEGLTYVWTPTQLADVLGEQEGVWVAELTAVTSAGTFEHGSSTLQLVRDPGADPVATARWGAARERLQHARAQRPQPARDDKVVTAWNGLAIAALAETGALLDRPDLVEAARRAAGLLLDVHRPAGRLCRTSREGKAGAPAAVLEDHGDLAEGLVALFAVTGERRWVEAAGAVVDDILRRFTTAAGDLSDSPLDDVDPILHHAAGGERPADPGDNAYPSGTSAAAGALLAWASLTGDFRARDGADRALYAGRRVAGASARFAGSALAVAEALLDGPREVAVVGPLADARTQALWLAALRGNAPGLVVAVADPEDAPAVPLLADRPLVAGAPAAYPCRGQVCDLPVTDVQDLERFALAAQSWE